VLAGVAALLAVAALLTGFFWRSGDRDGLSSIDEFRAMRGGFEVSVPTSGELAALNQVEIRNPLENRAVITWIIGEGETVKQGDVLVRFAEEEIRTEIQDDELDVLNSKNSVDAARSELFLQESSNASRLSVAQLAVEIAELALEQWREGDVKSMREELRAAREAAERNVERLTRKLEESEKLFEREFISYDELEQDRIEKLEADSRLQLATLNIEVYETYQYKIEEKQKNSDLAQAREELARVIEENKAQREAKENDLKTSEGEHALRLTRLRENQDQLAKCVITAPRGGLVVYGTSLESSGMGRGEQRTPPQIGTELRRNDLIIVLPDVSEMIAAVKVHESISGRIQPGQRATIIPDAMTNRILTGRVLSKGVLAETGNWRDPNRRDYTIRILLDPVEGLALKPSMRCKAEILVESVSDATYVPIQAVFRNAGRPFVYIRDASGWAQTPVRVGRTSELYAEIVDGIDAGTTVLLREPNPSEVSVKLPPAPTANGESASDASAEAIDPNAGFVPNPGGAPAEGAPASGAAGPGSGNPASGGGSMFGRFDANGDGLLQRDELPEQMQGMFDRLDANGDGAIDQTEAANMRRPGAGSGGGPRGATDDSAGERSGRGARGERQPDGNGESRGGERGEGEQQAPAEQSSTSRGA